MKNKLVLLNAIFFIFILGACKKDGAKPATLTSSTQMQPLTTAQLLLGKWVIVKDSVQTYDGYTPIPNILQPGTFSNNDYVVFNKDSTAAVSSAYAFSAFYVDYGAYNTDSKLFISPVNNPSLNFKYNVIPDYTIATTPSQIVYAVSMKNTNSAIGFGYRITLLTPTSLVLDNEEEIPTVLHDYRIKQYIYLQK